MTDAANTPRTEPVMPVEFDCPNCGEGIVLRGYFEHPEAAAPTPAARVREALRFLGSDDVLADGSIWTMDELAERIAAGLAAARPEAAQEDERP